MKTAQYNTGSELWTLPVLAENADGTVDLANATSGELKIGKCPVDASEGADVKEGHCKLVAPAAPSKPAAPEEPANPNADPAPPDSPEDVVKKSRKKAS